CADRRLHPFPTRRSSDLKQRAKDTGFLWGAYHFSSAGNVLDQVEHFLTVAEPDESDLVALDFEPSSHGPDMTIEQARQFVMLIRSEEHTSELQSLAYLVC